MAAILEQCTHLSIVEVEGSLHAPLSSMLRQSVQARLSRGERRILLDLSQVATMDAGGVGELMHVLDTTKAAGASLGVVRANTRILELLKIADVLRFLTAGGPPSPSFGVSPIRRV